MSSHLFTHVQLCAQVPGTEYDGKKPLPILDYSDTAQLGQPQAISFTLPGRTLATTKGRKPWSELIQKNLVAYAEGWTSTAEQPGQPYTLSHGFITEVTDSENLSSGSYQNTTTVTVKSGHDILIRDAVAWWMFYGSVEGWARARGELSSDLLSGRLDKIIANYTNKVAFHFASWRRGSATLGDLLGYHYTALRPTSPPLMNLAIQEGNHWSLMQSASDELHEFYSVVRPGNVKPMGGYAHHPAPSTSSIPRGLDGGATWLIHRPAPFPFGNLDGTGNVSEWRKVRLHDYSQFNATPAKVRLGEGNFGSSTNNVVNFSLVMPAIQLINEEMAFSMGIAVQNKDSIHQVGYSPKRVRTQLLLDEGNKLNVLQVAQSLTWRYAGQHNRRDEMRSGSFVMPMAPEICPGDRIRLRVPYGDSTMVMEGYILARTHRWNPTQGGTTTVQVDRMLPVSVYDDPSWFVKGLSFVKVGSAGKVPQASPTKKDAPS